MLYLTYSVNCRFFIMVLLKFNVENYRSFKDGISFTTERFDEGVYFKNFLIYGCTSSGKSNLISAIQTMRDFVLNSATRMGLITESCILNDVHKPTKFDIEFLHNKLVYVYGFTIVNNKVYKEYLCCKYDEGIEELFYRDYSEFRGVYDWSFSKKIKGANKRISKFVRSDSLYLSHAAQNNHKKLGDVFLWFRKLFIINKQEVIYYKNYKEYLNNIDFKYLLCDLLKFVDHTITDVNYNNTYREFILTHLVESVMETVYLRLCDESDSIQKMFYYSWYIYNAILNQGILVYDDLHKDFDKNLISYIERMFKDHLNCQLIYTSSDMKVSDSSAIILKRESFSETYIN